MACLDAAAVQAYVGGALSADERAAAELHVAGCESCRRLVDALAMTNAGHGTPPVTVATTTPHQVRRNAPELGTAIDRYRLTERLGHGGMGIVYKAHDPELRRDVAIKLLRAETSQAGSDELQARLLREAQAMAQVAHPNVIAIYDVGTWQDEVFLAMELATAGTLRQWCRNRPPAEILAAYLAAGRGLAAAHAAGLVHRDFKPDNALVGADGRVRVTDFGLARSHDAPADPHPTSQPSAPTAPLAALTVTGAVMGTPGYMAPEIFDGRVVDARSDQFAFCVALWEALFRQRPFAGVTERELADAAKAGRIVAPPATRGVSRAIERALRRGLDPDPAARWPSIEALLAALAPRTARTSWFVGATLLALAGAGVVAAAWPHTRPAPLATTARDGGVDAPDPDTARAAAHIDDLFRRLEAALEMSDFAGAERLSDESVAAARAAPKASRLVLMLGMRAQVYGWIDDLARAERAWREARAAAEAAGDDPLKAQIAFHLADVLDCTGKHEEADDIRKLSVATLSHRSSESSRLTALEEQAAVTGDAAVAKAEWDEALALRDRGFSSPWAGGAHGKLAGRALNRRGLAISLARAGRLDEARDELLAAIASSEQHGKSGDRAAALAVLHLSLAFVELQRGQCDDAASHARTSLEIGVGEISPTEPLAGINERALALALVCKGDHAGAEAALERALAALGARPLEQTITLEAVAGAELAHGDPNDALRHARAALERIGDHAIDRDQPARLDRLIARARGAHAAAGAPAYGCWVSTWLQYPEPPL